MWAAWEWMSRREGPVRMSLHGVDTQWPRPTSDVGSINRISSATDYIVLSFIPGLLSNLGCLGLGDEQGL